MRATISPGPLRGTLDAIPSKSDAHRAILAAALSDGPTDIVLSSFSQDIEATVACAAALGASAVRTPSGLRITPRPHGASARPALFFGESGTTARLVLPVAAALCAQAEAGGAGRLPERPMSAICRALSETGCRLSGDRLPLSLRGPLRAGVYELPGNISSQYISGLLFALPLLEGDSVIALTSPLQSSGYVDMTLRTLAAFGIEADARQGGWLVRGGQTYRSPGTYAVEGDYSNSAVWLCAGALGGDVTVCGLDPASLQPDRAVVQILERFGAQVDCAGGACRVRPGAGSRPLRLDVSETPDLVPVLAVLLASAAGESALENAGRLRLKESDRLHTVTGLLRDLGAQAEEARDSMRIAGRGALCGGRTDAHGDHRIAMAAALAASVCSAAVTIENAQAVEKSYPGFFSDLRKLGGRIDVE